MRKIDPPPPSLPSRRKLAAPPQRRVTLRRVLRVFFPVMLAGLLVLALGMLFRPRNSEEGLFSSFAVHPARNLVDIEISGEDEKGNPYRLKAEQAGMAGAGGTIVLHHIVAEMRFGEQDNPTNEEEGFWLVRAASGVYRPQARKLILDRRIELFSAAGDEIHTGRAEIDIEDEKIIMPGPVAAWGQHFTLVAGALEAHGKSEQMRFSGRVKFKLFLPPADEENNL